MTAPQQHHITLADYRMRVLNGENLTTAEYRQLIDDLRQSREVSTSNATAKGAAAKKKDSPRLDLNELFGGAIE